MSTAAIVIPRFNFTELLRLVGLPSKNVRTAELIGRANELLRTIAPVVDDLVSATMEERTAGDFIKTRSDVFPQYFSAMRALGDLASILLARQFIECASAEWFSELEADFKEHGPSAFGSDFTDRGVFTVWILRKIHDLGQVIAASALTKQPEGDDNELAMKFVSQAMWTRFHVDLLAKSMRDKKPIYPEVAEPIRNGLRAAVDAYASIRQWADLMNPRHEPELSLIKWTEEDEVLLADSMRDLQQESA